jgi:hypothetical protein
MKQTIIATAIQLAFGFLIVFIGWDMMYSILQPQSKNWGWLLEMKWSFTALSVLIVISNLALKDNKRRRNILLLVQFLFVLTYVAARYSIFPHRSMFLLAAYTLVIACVIPINRLIMKISS